MRAEPRTDARPAGRPEPVRLDHTHVMIVDDDAINQALLQAIIESLGVGRISIAGDGVECLALLDAGEPPDLVLLDVIMPNMDGFEACRRIRLRQDLRDLPVVIQTALDSPGDRHKCFQVGATDVIAKPLHRAEVGARLRVHLENRLMLRSLRHFQARLTEELRMAARMQTSLLPDTGRLARTLRPLGIRFDAWYRPCDEIGGDLWQVTRLDDRHLAVLVLDLTGHGLIAAINAFRVHGMLPFLSGYARDPGQWLSRLGDAMAEEFGGEVMATGLYGLIDSVEGRFLYASAGSPPPLLGRRTGAERGGDWSVTPLPSSGMMLGMIPGIAYPVRQAGFTPGDVLLLYSDGVSLTADGTEMAPEALAAVIAGCLPRDPAPALATIMSALPARTRQDDDVMMLWLGAATPGAENLD